MILIDKEKCIGCGKCIKKCAFGAISMSDKKAEISASCVACNSCISECPVNAIIDDNPRVVDESNKDEYKGILVVNVEVGKLENVACELLAKSRKMLADSDEKLSLLFIGELTDSIKGKCEVYGCDEIINIPEYAENDLEFVVDAVSQVISDTKPEIVLFPATANGRDVAPKVACRFETGLTADCTGLEIDDNGDLLQIRPTYGGTIMATIRTPNHRPQMASVRPGVFDMMTCRENQGQIAVSKFAPEYDEASSRVKCISKCENNQSYASLEEAEIVLAGGYGLGSKENFQLLFKLANKLGAAVAATRKAVDEGWASPEIQVGQTGKVIKPRVYIAFGISGAFQHTLGMKKSGKIIAVNNDPAAPIFNICDQAIFGNAKDIIEEMLKAE